MLRLAQHLPFDVEVELLLLCLGSALKFLADVLAEVGLEELVVDLEVAGGNDLEDGVSVVLEEEDVLVGLVLDVDVGVALDGE